VAVCVVAISATSLPNDDRTITHVLNRIAFGPRSGDVERVRQMGLQRYIEQQLHPDRVPDPGIGSRLAPLTTIRLTSRQIAEQYEQPLIAMRRERRQNAGAASAPAERPMPQPAQQRANTVIVELAEQKILRAVYSERQLQEVLTDFWFNHFNVDARKGRDRFLVTEYERDAIRPHVLGKFRDLLEATAKSPAMLFYLDNWMSVDPNGPHPTTAPPRVARGRFGPSTPLRAGGRVLVPAARAQSPNAPKGLNENYARELLELHTLGVDGGYTQKDVTEVARAFTGWTIENRRQVRSGEDGFVFRPQSHDPGQKVVLGHVIKAGGGESDGIQVLDLLAKHPSTARFIATKLARRFVSDAPPEALVQRLAERFQKTDGDLREVMRTLLFSPEFLSPDAVNAKAKSPFEFLVSALRTTNADVDDARPFVRMMQEMGMPLYQCQPPTGYKDTADAWINTGALVARMNAAVRLAPGDEPQAVAIGSPDFQRK